MRKRQQKGSQKIRLSQENESIQQTIVTLQQVQDDINVDIKLLLVNLDKEIQTFGNLNKDLSKFQFPYKNCFFDPNTMGESSCETDEQKFTNIDPSEPSVSQVVSTLIDSMCIKFDQFPNCSRNDIYKRQEILIENVAPGLNERDLGELLYPQNRNCRYGLINFREVCFKGKPSYMILLARKSDAISSFTFLRKKKPWVVHKFGDQYKCHWVRYYQVKGDYNVIIFRNLPRNIQISALRDKIQQLGVIVKHIEEISYVKHRYCTFVHLQTMLGAEKVCFYFQNESIREDVYNSRIKTNIHPSCSWTYETVEMSSFSHLFLRPKLTLREKEKLIIYLKRKNKELSLTPKKDEIKEEGEIRKSQQKFIPKEKQVREKSHKQYKKRKNSYYEDKYSKTRKYASDKRESSKHSRGYKRKYSEKQIRFEKSRSREYLNYQKKYHSKSSKYSSGKAYSPHQRFKQNYHSSKKDTSKDYKHSLKSIRDSYSDVKHHLKQNKAKQFG